MYTHSLSVLFGLLLGLGLGLGLGLCIIGLGESVRCGFDVRANSMRIDVDSMWIRWAFDVESMCLNVDSMCFDVD